MVNQVLVRFHALPPRDLEERMAGERKEPGPGPRVL